ncbi:dye-decolorizing heme-containing peroxidase [Marasmius crinis-equi]|uniref:Dye-decolorizing heme-containing peroxidase n=1 Tax=Marasmius crinis-equi TaxID=585013 RepID=A0ABR3G0C6_9AGAR
MRLSFVLCALSLSAFAFPDVHDLYSRQDNEPSAPLFINPAGQPSLPSEQQAASAAARVGLNLDNIQGDILIGMKKRKELFYFFQINNKASFKSNLKKIQPLITTTKQLLNTKSAPGSAMNLAFSQSGLTFLGVADDLKDDVFRAGQFADANNLGDPGTGNWIDAFKGTKVHGVILVAADTNLRLLAQLAKVKLLLGKSASEVYSLQGAARPGDQEGHEHFGYLDGISQPAINGFTDKPLPGQQLLDPGFFLLGEQGDSIQTQRPAWAKDGSFLAFRQLRQLVPEFNQFVSDNALKVPGLSAQENADLLGARMIGRWKSGAPVDLAPLRDDPALAKDSNRNNDFTFQHPGADIATNQTNCPFSAHIRKTRPRADFNPLNTANHIIRAGIPYGPEVTALEKTQKKSSDTKLLERGLAFVAYQSNIGSGFQFMQRNWVDNANFFFGKQVPPGVDPVIGSTNGGTTSINNPRNVSGLDPLDPSRIITIKKDFVISRGGEYFFTPSLSAILDPIAK